MTVNDQAAQGVSTVSAKDSWVKPEITAFAAAVEAQANLGGTALDSGKANLS
ncbi:hypothetical protein [Sphingomonas psychrolutea]|uniref:Uncharacterized protein n=1 Tax=Sphingomonas psychrolutea TaxID=1259676 RepID=A0ABQ1H3X8_9SPHN|nr:hypothetical protein [Sphingomonas psychrolutea]GGA56947.1 hypothetical protein GCM10011395_29210 [Sphingomonas psychrolutea]